MVHLMMIQTQALTIGNPVLFLLFDHQLFLDLSGLKIMHCELVGESNLDLCCIQSIYPFSQGEIPITSFGGMPKVL